MLTFTISGKELEKLKEWREEQNKKMVGREVGAIGGVYVYSFCDTNLGRVTRVRNDSTKDEIDLTDYSDW